MLATERRARLFAVCLAAMLIAATGTVMAFYSYTKRVSVTESIGVGTLSSGNSIRHAFAAAEAFAILRALGLPSAYAEKAVIKLGYLNEYVEHYTKRRQDPTTEVYKDLFNNAGGIAAARWIEACPAAKLSARDAVRSLAAQRALPYLHTDARLPALPGGAEVRAAIRKFKADKEEITRGVVEALEAGKPCGSRQPLGL